VYHRDRQASPKLEGEARWCGGKALDSYGPARAILRQLLACGSGRASVRKSIVTLAGVALLCAPAALATPAPYKHAEQACTSRGGSFGVTEGGGGYFCNFGGEAPKNWYGPTYQKVCNSYGGTIFEEFPPPYSYACNIP
jgi:hypothetical protein